MSVITQKYSDGYSPLPLTLVKKKELTISNYFGDPSISILNNLMIKSMTGNSSLENARVICLSDFHCDNAQKYIRAEIINEVIHSKKNKHKEVIFLLEGAQSGHVPNDCCYNKLIGENLIDSYHYVTGWDNMMLNHFGMRLVKQIKDLRSDSKEAGRKYKILSNKRYEILKDTTFSAKRIFDLTEAIELQMGSLMLQAKTIEIALESMLQQIRGISEQRNDSLHQTINEVLKNHPESIVFVIGGEHHFRDISDSINGVSHSILNLKEIAKITDFDEAFAEVYGDI